MFAAKPIQQTLSGSQPPTALSTPTPSSPPPPPFFFFFTHVQLVAETILSKKHTNKQKQTLTCKDRRLHIYASINSSSFSSHNYMHRLTCSKELRAWCPQQLNNNVYIRILKAWCHLGKCTLRKSGNNSKSYLNQNDLFLSKQPPPPQKKKKKERGGEREKEKI